MLTLRYRILAVIATLCIAGTGFAVYAAPRMALTNVTMTTAGNDNTPTFTWSAPHDTTGIVASYEVWIDTGSPTNSGNGTTYTAPTVLVDGTHIFYVRAKDTNGTLGDTASKNFRIDTIAPTVGTIIGINATVNLAQTFTVSYLDSVDVTSCTLFVNDANRGAMNLNGTKNGTASATLTLTTLGTYMVQARCADAATNMGIGALTTVTVSSPPPGPPDLTVPSAPKNLRRTSTPSETHVTLEWSASTDNVGVTGYQVALDGGVFISIGNTLMYTTGLIANGPHSVKVRAYDAVGNPSAATSLNFTVGAEVTVLPPSPPVPESPFSLEQMRQDSQIIITGSYATLQTAMGDLGCELSESNGLSRAITVFGSTANESTRAQIAVFTACGTQSTNHLGAGERLGVINSYCAAYGRLPSTAAEWNDVVKIANGRFPSEVSASAEANATARFRVIYLREPNMTNENDKAAVNVMAYGLRPLPRNLNSEANSQFTFHAVFKVAPTSAVHWDAVRAISYSGAMR